MKVSDVECSGWLDSSNPISQALELIDVEGSAVMHRDQLHEETRPALRSESSVAFSASWSWRFGCGEVRRERERARMARCGARMAHSDRRENLAAADPERPTASARRSSRMAMPISCC